jgi:hypothetical protein
VRSGRANGGIDDCHPAVAMSAALQAQGAARPAVRRASVRAALSARLTFFAASILLRSGVPASDAGGLGDARDWLLPLGDITEYHRATAVFSSKTDACLPADVLTRVARLPERLHGSRREHRVNATITFCERP